MQVSEPEKAINIARRIPSPRSYFKGISSVQFELPKNLIVFHRHRSRDLGKELHFHHRFVLIINLETAGKVVIDSRIFDFGPGYALLIFPHQYHHYLDIDSTSINWLCITFEIYDTTPLEPMRNSQLELSNPCYVYLQHLLDNYHHKENVKNNNFIQMFLLAGLILMELLNNCSRTASRRYFSRSSLIDRVNGYIWKNIGRQIKLEKIAKSFSLSESHLRYLFRKKMGISIGVYIKQLRINRARSFLISSSLNVSEIAYRCGYDSLYSFSRAFKKCTGTSPLSYKKSMAKFTPAVHNLPSEPG
ncbi:helix-turn-helix domain-containing protein [Fibrobacterota bacterium]